jgi:hypothetical protein
VKNANVLALAGLVFTGLLSSCEPNNPEKISLALHVETTFDNAPVVFDVSQHVNQAGETLVFKRLDYLLSDFTLLGGPNGDVGIKGSYAFVKGKTGAGHIELDSIPVGQYTGIRFNIGLDSMVNHGDPSQYGPSHPLNPNVNRLHWDWTGGYIFTALEGTYKHPGHPESVFLYHMALDRNKRSVTVSFPMDLTKRDKLLHVDYNLAEIFRNPTTFSIEEKGDFSHSTFDNGIVEALVANMGDVFTAKHLQNK